MQPNQPIQPADQPLFGSLLRLITVDRQVALIDPRNIRRVIEHRTVQNEAHPTAKAVVSYQRPRSQEFVTLAVRTSYEEIRDRASAALGRVIEIFEAQQPELGEEFEERDRVCFTSLDQILSIEETQMSLGEEGEEDPDIQMVTVIQTVWGQVITCDTIERIEELNANPSRLDVEEIDEPKQAKRKPGAKKGKK